MCRSIKTLFNFEPPVSEDEIHAAALQFVRKLSGFTAPSKANEAAFGVAVDDITAAARTLLGALETHAPPKNRAEEAAKARTPRCTAVFNRGVAACWLSSYHQSNRGTRIEHSATGPGDSPGPVAHAQLRATDVALRDIIETDCRDDRKHDNHERPKNRLHDTSPFEVMQNQRMTSSIRRV